MQVWRDIKCRTYNKATKLKKDKIQTGDRDPITLTNLERKVMALMNRNYTFGTSCADAILEEDVSLIHFKIYQK